MRTKTKILIAALIIVSAITVMMVTGFLNLSGRQVTIEQVLAPGFDYDDKFLRVEGELIGDYIWSAANYTLEFQITDGESVLKVFHEGNQPDNFYEGVQVIAQGYYRGDGLFVAETLQTRCPSTYEEEIAGEEDPN